MLTDPLFYFAALLLVLSAVAIGAVVKLTRELRNSPPTGEDAKKKTSQMRLQIAALFVLSIIGELAALAMILRIVSKAIFQ